MPDKSCTNCSHETSKPQCIKYCIDLSSHEYSCDFCLYKLPTGNKLFCLQEDEYDGCFNCCGDKFELKIMKEYEYPYLELLDILNEYVQEDSKKIESELTPIIKMFEENLVYLFNIREIERDELSIVIIHDSLCDHVICKPKNFFTASILFGEYIPCIIIESFIDNNVLTIPKTGNQIIFQDDKYIFNKRMMIQNIFMIISMKNE